MAYIWYVIYNNFFIVCIRIQTRLCDCVADFDQTKRSIRVRLNQQISDVKNKRMNGYRSQLYVSIQRIRRETIKIQQLS